MVVLVAVVKKGGGGGSKTSGDGGGDGGGDGTVAVLLVVMHGGLLMMVVEVVRVVSQLLFPTLTNIERSLMTIYNFMISYISKLLVSLMARVLTYKNLEAFGSIPIGVFWLKN